MSYTIDIYRGKLKPTESLIDFALFVAFFPQMVAGPIARASELLPQFQRFRSFDWPRIQSGVYLIFWGFFKKVFIADNLLRLVSGPYRLGAEVNGPQVLFATYAFAFQIYCDFSAYSDIARGVSRLMGIELMLNFNIPYAATNPRDFWRRWHISLSTWLRDYLYLSLGGNRGSAAFIYRNLMITMILGGIWHGARANFVWWGIYQGLLLCVHRLLEPVLVAVSPQNGWKRRLYRLVCWGVFFHLVCYGWLLFRAESNEQIWRLTQALFVGWDYVGDQMGTLVRLIFYCWPLWLVQCFQLRTDNLLAPLCWPWPARLIFYLGLFYLMILFGAFHVVEFIYFQF
jgi:D-alanyl-lipoteichoic acid acyltransferase DltB (MBOAT superfamily)